MDKDLIYENTRSFFQTYATIVMALIVAWVAALLTICRDQEPIKISLIVSISALIIFASVWYFASRSKFHQERFQKDTKRIEKWFSSMNIDLETDKAKSIFNGCTASAENRKKCVRRELVRKIGEMEKNSEERIIGFCKKATIIIIILGLLVFIFYWNRGSAINLNNVAKDLITAVFPSFVSILLGFFINLTWLFHSRMKYLEDILFDYFKLE